MIRMCFQAVILKYSRVLYNFLITEFFHIPPRMILCVKTALSAPVLGWESASVNICSLLFVSDLAVLFLFHCTGNSFRKLLLQDEEDNNRRQ